jgi:hypothetical protein
MNITTTSRIFRNVAIGHVRNSKALGGLLALLYLPYLQCHGQVHETSEIRQATVRCLWYSRPDGKDSPASGGSSPVVIRVAPNAEKMAPLAIGEDYAEGTGEMWRSAAWIAAILASQQTDHQVEDHEFTVRAGGFIDGPSAGMLISTTMMALIKNEAVQPHTSITGTVNPDGTCGPVGGIVQKMKGAAGDGIKRFGFPKGCRNCIDENDPTGAPVDLIKLASELKIEAKEIGDIFESFEFLTQKAISRPKVVDEQEMVLPPALHKELTVVIRQLRADAEAHINEAKLGFSKLYGATDGLVEFSGNAKLAIQSLEQCKSAELQNEMGMALRLAEAHFKSSISLKGRLKFTELMMQRPADSLLEAARFCLAESDLVEKDLEAIRTTLINDVLRKPTVGAKVDALNDFSYYWDARGSWEAARLTLAETVQELSAILKPDPKGGSGEPSIAAALKTSPPLISGAINHHMARSSESDSVGGGIAEKLATSVSVADTQKTAGQKSFGARSDELWNQLDKVITNLATAQARVRRTHLARDIVTDNQAPAQVSDELWTSLGRSYSAAGAAGLSWYTAMKINGLAKQLNTSKDNVLNYFLATDEPFAKVYVAAKNASRSAAAQTILSQKPSEYSAIPNMERQAASVDQLVSGLYAYHGAARLVNTHYNFSKGPDGFLSNRAALTHSLELAQKRVLESAARAKEELGFIPTSIKINYDLAKSQRDKTDEEKLSSLVTYWKCLFISDLARHLGRDR